VNRTTAAWFGVAAVLALIRVGLAVIEPNYYSATSITDHLAVVTLTGTFLASGVALILLWRDPPINRGAPLLAVAGLGAIAAGTGNLLEDSFGMEDAVLLFFGGGFVLMIALLVAGITALTVRSPRRWSGLFLLFAVPGGMLGFGGVMMATAWTLLAFWLVSERRGLIVAQAIALVPAISIALVLYGSDVVG